MGLLNDLARRIGRALGLRRTPPITHFLPRGLSPERMAAAAEALRPHLDAGRAPPAETLGDVLLFNLVDEICAVLMMARNGVKLDAWLISADDRFKPARIARLDAFRAAQTALDRGLLREETAAALSQHSSIADAVGNALQAGADVKGRSVAAVAMGFDDAAREAAALDRPLSRDTPCPQGPAP